MWIKRAIGAAALGGGLLALSAGAAGAQEVSADVSARLGRQTSAEVRVCAGGRVLPGLLGSCGQAGSGTSVTVDAGRDSDGTRVRARAHVPRLATAGVSVGTRRSRPAGASGQAATTPRAQADVTAAAGTSPGASADATARLSRLRDGRLLDLDGEVSLAGVGLLGSSPFTLAGDPATDSLLPTGELTLGDLTGEAPAGIGVLETGPIASGNQVDAGIGDVSPSVPVTVCGNSVGVLGDAAAGCGTGQPAAGTSIDTSAGGGAGTGGDTGGSDTGTDVGIGSDTSTGGIIAPPPGTTPGQTGTDGTPGSDTGTSGIPGTTPGTTGTSGLIPDPAGDAVTTFAPLRPTASGSGALPFTGAASDLLALVAAGMLAAGALVVRATRPAAAREGGEDR